MKKVAVIMGSDSDFPVMKNAVKSLKDMGTQWKYMCFPLTGRRRKREHLPLRPGKTALA